MRDHGKTAVLILAAVCAQSGLALAEDRHPIAGLEPSHRPEGAPVIREVQRDADWFAQALTGISQPYPASLRFLEDQGNWYTPFNRPGMTGRYDIRGWHAR
jgi:hypothetical protein